MDWAWSSVVCCTVVWHNCLPYGTIPATSTNNYGTENEDKFFIWFTSWCYQRESQSISISRIETLTATRVRTIGIRFEIKQERTTEVRNSSGDDCVAECWPGTREARQSGSYAKTLMDYSMTIILYCGSCRGESLTGGLNGYLNSSKQCQKMDHLNVTYKGSEFL